MSRYVMSSLLFYLRVMSRHVISCHVLSSLLLSSRVTSCVTWCHVVSFPVMLRRVQSCCRKSTERARTCSSMAELVSSLAEAAVRIAPPVCFCAPKRSFHHTSSESSHVYEVDPTLFLHPLPTICVLGGVFKLSGHPSPFFVALSRAPAATRSRTSQCTPACQTEGAMGGAETQDY